MTLEIPSEKMQEILDAIKRGNSEEAIGICRAQTNCNLEQAKGMIEALQLLSGAKEQFDFSLPDSQQTILHSDFSMTVNGVTLPDDVAARLQAALDAGRKVEAVKIYRDATHATLKQAVDTVEILSLSSMSRSGADQYQPQPAMATPARSLRDELVALKSRPDLPGNASARPSTTVRPDSRLPNGLMLLVIAVLVGAAVWFFSN